MGQLVKKLKAIYAKPAFQGAIDAMIVALMEQFLKPRGWKIVKDQPDKSEPENNE